MQRNLAEFSPVQVGLAGRQAADQVGCQRFGRQAPQEIPDLLHQRPADVEVVNYRLDDPAAGFGMATSASASNLCT